MLLWVYTLTGMVIGKVHRYILYDYIIKATQFLTSFTLNQNIEFLEIIDRYVYDVYIFTYKPK